ncbi:MAG TPA: hypothetical protein VNC82_12585, partial [Candidatus Limnocylindria bacterium]|nr:hypothetical protein [Candidatus Limnocylindria bacterium]
VPAWPAAAPAEIGQARAAASRAEAAYLAALRRRHGYHLVSRNCVTEIFRQIDAAFAAAADISKAGAGTAASRARAESIRRLGGHVDAGAGLHFIPAAADLAVAERYAVAARLELPSLRHRRLDLMYQAEPGPLVFLRESNTVTSTAYRRHPEDSVFLFFTEGAVISRPILGALNLVTGIGAAAAGLATLPVDGGGLLRAGLRGVVFSLPELAFFNIRKGSFDAVDSHRDAERAPAGPPGRAAADVESEGDRAAGAAGAR